MKSEALSVVSDPRTVLRQARTFDKILVWFFSSLNAQWWISMDNVVYCNSLRSEKSAFLK